MNPLFQKAAEIIGSRLGRKYFDPWMNKQSRTVQIWVCILFLIFMGWFAWWCFIIDSPYWIYSAVFCPIVLFYLIALKFFPDWLERRKMKIAIAEKERNKLPEICPTCRAVLDKGESGDCKFCKQLKKERIDNPKNQP